MAQPQLFYLRTDSIGDHVLAAGMLPLVKIKYSDHRIMMVCQKHIAELYERCPFVDDTITYDKKRLTTPGEDAYATEVAETLRARKADVLLNTVYSRDPVSEFLTINSGAREKIGMVGDMANIDASSRAISDPQYTKLIDSPGEYKHELLRHLDFLKGLGINTGSVPQPVMWTGAEDVEAATRIMAANDLPEGATIALFAGTQCEIKDYEGFGLALQKLCHQRGLKVVALGSQREFDINARNLSALASDAVNLCGKTSLRQSAEILRRCRLAIGCDTSLAHFACAVRTRNVILVGGGHFGRFIPYSPLTSVVCLPIECYGCGWICRYSRPHCVQDVLPAVVEAAIAHTLDNAPSAKARVFAQGPTLWQPTLDQPRLSWSNHLLPADQVELLTVGT
jgi:ADP-heptose:LPS heptosyltransferase